MLNKWAEQCKFEDEGKAAAHEGKRREDCPYPKTEETAWNFWVYGNENEQNRLVRELMRTEGTPQLWMSTGPLSPESIKALNEYQEKYDDAEKRLRAQNGWPD